MKKLVYIFLTLVALTGCKKNDWLDWRAQNDAWFARQSTYTYVDPVNGDSVFTLLKTDLGVKYCILSDPNPTQARPSASSYVTIHYTGSLINGAVFDSGIASRVEMSSLVTGFADALKRIHVDGDVVMYVPYNLGYGSAETGTEGTTSYIPPYSMLIFTVHLDAVE